MTIEETVDIIKSRLKPVDQTGQFHEETIRFAMSFIWNQLISDSVKKGDFSSLEFYSKEYTGQTASVDGTTGEYYIDLPVAICTMVDDRNIQKGVRNLDFATSRGFTFIPTTTKAYRLYSGQSVMDVILTKKIFYIVRRDKLIFLGTISAANIAILTGTGIRFDLVQSLDEYGYTEEIVIPDGKYEDFLLKTVNYLMGTPPVDLKNDNA
jgi:hypothetical protein